MAVSESIVILLFGAIAFGVGRVSAQNGDDSIFESEAHKTCCLDGWAQGTDCQHGCWGCTCSDGGSQCGCWWLDNVDEADYGPPSCLVISGVEKWEWRLTATVDGEYVPFDIAEDDVNGHYILNGDKYEHTSAATFIEFDDVFQWKMLLPIEDDNIDNKVLGYCHEDSILDCDGSAWQFRIVACGTGCSPPAVPGGPPSCSTHCDSVPFSVETTETSDECARGHLVAKGRTSWGGWDSSALDYYCQTDDDNQADYASKKHGYDIGVGCCSMDGTTGDRPDCGARPSTFEEAEAVCSEHDMRLCTLEEMLNGKSNGKGITEGTGCWFDAAYQWTASECVSTDQAAPSHGHGPNEVVDGGAISFDDLIPMALGAAAGAALIAAIVAMVVVMRKRKAAAKQRETELEAVHIPNTSTMTVSAEVTETANTEQMAEMEAVTVSTAEVDAVAVE